MRALGDRCRDLGAVECEHRAHAAQDPAQLRAAAIVRGRVRCRHAPARSLIAAVPGDRYPLAANAEAGPALGLLRDTLYRLENWLFANWIDARRFKTSSEPDAESERRRDLLLRSVVAHETAIDRIEAGSDEAIAWAERNDADGRYSVHCAPHDVAEFLRAALFTRVPSVVITSATLSTGGSFAFVRRTLGIDDAQELIAPSPFDYARQARLFIASGELNPKSKDFARRAAPVVEECLDRSRGRAFVLFTSYARLREVYALVRERVGYPIRLQGQLPRSHLIDWFRRTPGAVLFATGTFWEGIDVAGDALSCVIIDRLPFPSPSDPLVMARIRALEARGARRLRELHGSGGDGPAQTGIRPAHSQRNRPRRSGAARRARFIDALRCFDSRLAAAGAADRSARRAGAVLQRTGRVVTLYS